MNRIELGALAQSERDAQRRFRCRVLCCMSSPCISSGAAVIAEKFAGVVQADRLAADVEVVSTGCMGPCSRGPLVTIQSPGEGDVIYERVAPAMVDGIIDRHLNGADAPTLDRHFLPGDIPFFARQEKVVLAQSGKIDPERLESYIAAGGYTALGHAIREMTPSEVCDEIVKSGLRGRGGAGYPTGLKWQTVQKAPGGRKFVVANGDEGDPGAYMDRTTMESDPTGCSRAWPSPPTPSVPIRGISMSAVNIPWRPRGSKRRFDRRSAGGF